MEYKQVEIAEKFFDCLRVASRLAFRVNHMGNYVPGVLLEAAFDDLRVNAVESAYLRVEDSKNHLSLPLSLSLSLSLSLFINGVPTFSSFSLPTVISPLFW